MRSSIRIGLGVIVLAGMVAALHATRPSDPGPSSDCEAIGDGLLRQPTNSLSALALVAVGIALAAGSTPPGRLIGGGAAAAGTTSVLAHATLHPLAQAADGVAVVASLTLIGAAMISAASIDWIRIGAAGALAAVGVAVWAASRTGGPLCDPGALLGGGHAGWHLLAAGAVGLTGLGLSDRLRKP